MKRVIIFVIVLALALFSVGCTDNQTAERVLRQNGYTNIVLTGYAAWSCGEDDQFATGFTATSPSGQQVSGAVCSAWMKGATIRFD